MLRYNKSLKECSKLLRVNMTEAERLLWEKIKGKQLKGCQFYRQKTIGNYIVDFHCPKAKLVIELDGGQHYSSEGEEKDQTRDKYMLLIFKYLKKVLSFFPVIARLDRAIQRKVLDYPVEPDNDTIGTEFAMTGIGLKVLRFSDKEVFNNTQGVLERIWGYL